MLSYWELTIHSQPNTQVTLCISLLIMDFHPLFTFTSPNAPLQHTGLHIRAQHCALLVLPAISISIHIRANARGHHVHVFGSSLSDVRRSYGHYKCAKRIAGHACNATGRNTETLRYVCMHVCMCIFSYIKYGWMCNWEDFECWLDCYAVYLVCWPVGLFVGLPVGSFVAWLVGWLPVAVAVLKFIVAAFIS